MENGPTQADAFALPREGRVAVAVAQPALGPAATSPGRTHARASDAPFWLWPHLLSLDAPIVALVWQAWWAGSFGHRLTLGQRVVLGLGVWLIYLADRVADAFRRGCDDQPPARHQFFARRRFAMAAIAVTVGSALVVLAPLLLDAAEFRAGLILLAAAGLYFWSIHRRASSRWTRRVPKEALVGAFFAFGTCFFTRAQADHAFGAGTVAVILFGVCCFLNCALISCWERTADDLRDRSSFVNAFPGLAAGLGPCCWMLAALATALAGAESMELFAPIALAAALLGILQACKSHISPDALRCLVDLALLSPLVWLFAKPA